MIQIEIYFKNVNGTLFKRKCTSIDVILVIDTTSTHLRRHACTCCAKHAPAAGCTLLLLGTARPVGRFSAAAADGHLRCTLGRAAFYARRLLRRGWRHTATTRSLRWRRLCALGVGWRWFGTSAAGDAIAGWFRGFILLLPRGRRRPLGCRCFNTTRWF